MTGKCKYYRNKVNNKKHAKKYFYDNLDIIVSDFQNNDKRKFWKAICHFVKNDNSTSFNYSFMFITSIRWQSMIY